MSSSRDISQWMEYESCGAGPSDILPGAPPPAVLDDDSFRRRVEKIAFQYLLGAEIHIHTATLRGPFETSGVHTSLKRKTPTEEGADRRRSDRTLEWVQATQYIGPRSLPGTNPFDPVVELSTDGPTELRAGEKYPQSLQSPNTAARTGKCHVSSRTGPSHGKHHLQNHRLSAPAPPRQSTMPSSRVEQSHLPSPSSSNLEASSDSHVHEQARMPEKNDKSSAGKKRQSLAMAHASDQSAAFQKAAPLDRHCRTCGTQKSSSWRRGPEGPGKHTLKQD